MYLLKLYIISICFIIIIFCFTVGLKKNFYVSKHGYNIILVFSFSSNYKKKVFLIFSYFLTNRGVTELSIRQARLGLARF